MASPTITLALKTEHWERAIQKLGATANVATARALNRAAGTVRTKMARLVATDMKIPVGSPNAKHREAHSANEAMSVEQATAERLQTRVIAKSGRLPLIVWVSKGQQRPSRGKGRGIAVTAPGLFGHYPNAFYAEMASGHKGIFKRTGPGRVPIVELHGASIPKVFDKHHAEGVKAGEAALVKNLQHEFRWALQQAATGS